MSRKEKKKQNKMRIRYRLEKEIKDFPEQKLANCPDLELTKLFHGCGIRCNNGFNILIDKNYTSYSLVSC